MKINKIVNKENIPVNSISNAVSVVSDKENPKDKKVRYVGDLVLSERRRNVESSKKIKINHQEEALVKVVSEELNAIKNDEINALAILRKYKLYTNVKPSFEQSIGMLMNNCLYMDINDFSKAHDLLVRCLKNEFKFSQEFINKTNRVIYSGLGSFDKQYHILALFLALFDFNDILSIENKQLIKGHSVLILNNFICSDKVDLDSLLMVDLLARRLSDLGYILEKYSNELVKLSEEKQKAIMNKK